MLETSTSFALAFERFVPRCGRRSHRCRHRAAHTHPYADRRECRYLSAASVRQVRWRTERLAWGRRTSPVVRRRCALTNRPWNELISARADFSRDGQAACASVRRRARSACRVESTMSVNSTVASTRSGGCSCRCPVRNSSISPVTDFMSPTKGMWSTPSSSTSRAPCILRAARSRPSSTGQFRHVCDAAPASERGHFQDVAGCPAVGAPPAR